MLEGSDIGVKMDLVKKKNLEYPKKNPRNQIEIEKSKLTCKAQNMIPGRRGGR